MITINNFSESEIVKLNSYVSDDLEMTNLGEAIVYMNTEDTLEKIEVFRTCYRLIENVKNSVDEEEIRKKLDSLIKENEKTYNELYGLCVKLNDEVNYGRYEILKQINLLLKNSSSNINNVINIIKVLSRTKIIHSFKDIAGFRLDTPEGRKLAKEMVPDD